MATNGATAFAERAGLVFHGDRWARVFVAALGGNAESGLLCLRALVPTVKAVPWVLSGYSAARRLEKMLRESVREAGFPEGDSTGRVLEFVIRFIVLFAERGRFKHVDLVLEKIENRIDTQKGALAVTLESAVSLDGTFPDGIHAEELRRCIAEKTGAAEVKMKTRVVPELLGGYRLQIGGFFVDASLRKQVEKMKADLEAEIVANNCLHQLHLSGEPK